MAVRSSAPVSLVADIVDEFGGSAPYSLTDYYRGGSLVPNGPDANNNIPTSGAISLTNFLGATNTVTWTTVVTVAVVSGIFTQSGFFGSNGSLSDSTVDFLSGTPTVSRIEFASLGTTPVSFKINGSGNSGWTTIQIGSLTLNRTDANSFSDGLWTWTGQSNPFGSADSETTVVLTQ